MNERRVAAVVGASSGIGREFVRFLAKREEFDAVYAFARRKDRLDALREELGEKVIPVRCDVLNEDPLAYLSEGDNLFFSVYSAGVGYSGAAEELKREDQEKTVDLNCRALVAFCNNAAKRTRSGGRIVVLSSASAYLPQPYFAVYAASKSFALSYARALAAELKNRRISVTAICPGPVDTEFFSVGTPNGRVSAKKKKYMISAEKVVKRGFRAAEKRKGVCIPSGKMRLAAVGSKLLPHGLLIKFFKKEEKK